MKFNDLYECLILNLYHEYNYQQSGGQHPNSGSLNG